MSRPCRQQASTSSGPYWDHAGTVVGPQLHHANLADTVPAPGHHRAGTTRDHCHQLFTALRDHHMSTARSQPSPARHRAITVPSHHIDAIFFTGKCTPCQANVVIGCFSLRDQYCCHPSTFNSQAPVPFRCDRMPGIASKHRALLHTLDGHAATYFACASVSISEVKSLFIPRRDGQALALCLFFVQQCQILR